jgi:hypothetical protein
MSSHYLSKNVKFKIYQTIGFFTYCLCWQATAWNLVFYTKEITQTLGVWKQNTEKNIWNEKYDVTAG